MKETGVKFFFAPFCFTSWIWTFHAPCTYNLSLAAVSKCNLSVSWGDSDDKESGKVTKGERLPVHTTRVPSFFLVFPISLLLVIYLRTWRTARIPQLKPHCLSLRLVCRDNGWQEHWSCCGLLVMQQSSTAMGVKQPYQERRSAHTYPCQQFLPEWARSNASLGTEWFA
jgi:hypothetical protein